jgi:DNA-binding NarL/FixJ family response regulator
MQDATRVGMVDESQDFIDDICRCLSHQSDLVVAGTATSLVLAEAAGLFGACDVLTLALDDRTPLPLLLEIAEAHPALGIVVVADTDEEPLLLDAVAYGAKAWVTRDDGPEELLAALREVGRGSTRYPTAPLRALLIASVDRWGQGTALAARPLTPRESDVLSCLAAGMSRREVGATLELSDNTVRTYVRRILRKLHVRSAPAAVALIQERETTHG